MSATARKRLVELQKNLYDQALSDAQLYLQNSSPSLKRYANEYQNNLPKSAKKTNRDHIINTMHKHRYVLYGDFHTLRQNQNGMLKLLKAYHKKFPNRPITIAMESFKHIDQEKINLYLKSMITDTDFLEQVQWKEEWGYSWESYRPILEFAKKHYFKVVGINTPRGGKDELDKRDHYASEVLLDIGSKYANDLIVCMIGELHLADKHLTGILRKRCEDLQIDNKIVRIVNNVDQYFFGKYAKHNLQRVNYLALKENFFSIQNAPPWIKWQTYIISEELKSIDDEYDDPQDDEFDLYTEDTYDFDSHFLSLLNHIKKFLRLQIHHDILTKFCLVTFPDQETIDDLSGSWDIERSEVARISKRIAIDGFHFVPKANLGIINNISMNNLSYITGQFLHNVLNKKIEAVSETDQFFKRVLAHAAGMIATKILNPRRKGTDIWYFRRFLGTNKKQNLQGHAQNLWMSAKAVIKIHEYLQRQYENNNKLTLPKSIVTEDTKLAYDISRSYGQLLGHTLYSRVMGQSAPADAMRLLFTFQENTCFQSQFSMIYRATNP